MKHAFLISALAVITLSCSRDFTISPADVPQPVLAAFQAKYPEATNVSWEIEKEQGRLLYEAEWKFSGKEHEAFFRPDGSFVRAE